MGLLWLLVTSNKPSQLNSGRQADILNFWQIELSLAGLISLRDTGCRSPMAIQPEVEVCNSVSDFSRTDLQELGSFALASPRGEGGGMTAENPGDLHGVEQLFHVSCAFW